MKIGAIGKGNVGGALTRLWQQAGHDQVVSVGHRYPKVNT
jgi:predicted dinucleotide-binding enzyme